MFNLLIGGAAGQGIETMASVLQKFLKDSGLYVFTTRDIMSRIRGGHNFTLLRIDVKPVFSHSTNIDGIIAFDKDTVMLHKEQLKESGFILCDSQWELDDKRCISLDMTALSKKLGNSRVIGSIATGTVLKLFGRTPVNIDETLKKYINEPYREMNKAALLQGYELVDARYSLPESNPQERIIISGNQAVAYGAIAAGIRFYSAYPMSPSTTILEYLASKSEEANIVVEQAEDEIAAINMAIGASFAGVPSMTGTSGGGFCLKVEALGLSGMAEIPIVVADIQRPGPSTGFPTRTEQSDLKFVISASHGEFPRMVIALRNHQDAFYQTARAFYLARKYQIPVILLSDQYLADTSATIEPYDLTNLTATINMDMDTDMGMDEGEYLRYRLTEDGISPLLIPGQSRNFVESDSDEHDEAGHITEDAEIRNRMMEKRLGKLIKLKEELMEPEFFGEELFDILFLGWGSTYGPIMEAVRTLNQESSKKYAALIFGDVYPLPERLLKEKAQQADHIINIEQNATGQLAELIREKTGIECSGSILKYDGRQLSGDEIVDRIRKGERE
ncbi:2-oxoacid:acceptor oxidoreductase subunit alpha [Clostridium aminobutyricum]|uniref:2-oxoacid:acceptor oxidoreductase subunit alpha n=1 Tax=Clostridium aminobutyricum TaxID=33953 RepID=A0A939DA99_CLOAM|nr:2-oxoacid:acceptor oxidoreductase subunit alpha [Clostridium aminobutyricum]MBN7773598.1 2-oxoacid:acceptor oxidoreductase subunit alpha [Clostridium aminobutyricum]